MTRAHRGEPTPHEPVVRRGIPRLSAGGALLALWLAWASGPAFAPCQPIAAEPRSEFLDANYAAERFPYASALDWDRDVGPTGGRGFLLPTDEGLFRFEDGSRGRFFGVNIAKTAVFVDDAAMDRMVDVIRAAGLNLVRLHHFDGPEGILGPERDELGLFTASRLERIDRWIHRLGQAGIYVYLDLLDYRVFGAADGVPGGEELGRGAKPYVVLDSRIRDAAIDYAVKLLSQHINPYTGKSYREDPTVAFVEIYDENGLFIRRDDLPGLREPWKSALAREWNDWLRVRYRSTEGLRAAWTDPTTGQCPLVAGESVEAANVAFPRLVLRPANEPMPNTGTDGAARVNEAVQFLQQIEFGFFRNVTRALRQAGVRVPIGAVGSLNLPPDHAVMSLRLDFIGTNFYWDHPSWLPGRDWTPPYWFANRSPLSDTGQFTAAPAIASARVRGTPLVVREWGYCWPNESRAIGPIEIAAFCAHQGIDCVLAFTYGVSDPPAVGLFDLQADPARWGLLAHAAALYLHGGVREASTRVEIANSMTDIASFHDYATPLLELAWVTRLERRLDYGKAPKGGPPTLTVASGRSADTAVGGSGRLLWNEVRRSDLKGTLSVGGVVERSGYTLARTIPDEPQRLGFGGFAFEPNEDPTVRGERLFVTSELQKRGLRPIGASQDGKCAAGFADASTSTWGFGRITPDTATRAAFDALGLLGPSHINHQAYVTGRMVSDTGQISRDSRRETIAVTGEWAVAVGATQLGAGDVSAGPLRVSSPVVPFAAIAVSAGTVPLSASRRVSIRYVTGCENTGQTLRPEAGGPKPFLLANPGSGPPRVRLIAHARPLEVWWSGRLLARVYGAGGAFEFVTTPEGAWLIGNGGGIEVETADGRRLRMQDGWDALRLE